MSSAVGSYLTGQLSVPTGQGSVLTATGVCAPFPHKLIKDGASFLTGNLSLPTATTPGACGGESGCLSHIFTGPYTVPATAAQTYHVVDIATLDLSSFGAGLPYWRASLTILSPSDWLPFRTDAALYLDSDFLIVGDAAPPLAVNQVTGPINYSTPDQGPANATNTITSAVLQTSDVPRAPLQLRLVIITATNRTNTIVSATFEICDHPFT